MPSTKDRSCTNCSEIERAKDDIGKYDRRRRITDGEEGGKQGPMEYVGFYLHREVARS
jgi:hypothetical protein